MAIDQMLSDALSDKKDEMPSTRLKGELAKHSRNAGNLKKILKSIWIKLDLLNKCKNANLSEDILDENFKKCHRSYKSLALTDFLLKNGSDEFVTDCRRPAHVDFIKDLVHFEADVGNDEHSEKLILNIRERAKEIANLLSNQSLLQQVRQECREAEQYRNMVLALTENVEGLPSVPEMNEVLECTGNHFALNTIMSTVWERLCYMDNTYTTDRDKCWNSDRPTSCAPMFLRTLSLLNHLIKNGGSQVTEICLRNIIRIEVVLNFKETDSGLFAEPNRNEEVRENVSDILDLLEELQENENESTINEPQGLLATRSPSPIRRSPFNSASMPLLSLISSSQRIMRTINPIPTKRPCKTINGAHPNFGPVAARKSSKNPRQQPTKNGEASASSLSDEEEIFNESLDSQSSAADSDKEQLLLMDSPSQRNVSKRRGGSTATVPQLSIKRARATNSTAPTNHRLFIGEDEAMEEQVETTGDKAVRRAAIEGEDTVADEADLNESMESSIHGIPTASATEQPKKKIKRLHSTEAERLSMDEGVQRMEGTDSPRRRSVATKKDVPAMSHLTATEESETDALKNEAANREKKMTKNKRDNSKAEQMIVDDGSREITNDDALIELRAQLEQAIKTISEQANEIMLAKTETEDESGERRKIELKLAAVENEKKEMGNIISQLQNQIAEGRKNEGEEKKKMEGEIETLKNEIKMINERNEKVAEEKRVEIEALKSKVAVVTVALEKRAEENEKLERRVATLENSNAVVIEDLRDGPNAIADRSLSHQMYGADEDEVHAHDTAEYDEDEDGKVGDDENDDEMEGAESDEENENDSGDENSSSGDKEIRENENEDAEGENGEESIFNVGEKVYAKVASQDPGAYPAIVIEIKERKDGHKDYVIKYEQDKVGNQKWKPQYIYHHSHYFQMFKEHIVLLAKFKKCDFNGFVVGKMYTGGRKRTEIMRKLRKEEAEVRYELGECVMARARPNDYKYWPAEIIQVVTSREKHCRYQVHYENYGSAKDHFIEEHEVHLLLKKMSEVEQEKMTARLEKKKRKEQVMAAN